VGGASRERAAVTRVIVPRPGEYLLPVHIQRMAISKMTFLRLATPRSGRPSGKSARVIDRDRHMAHEVLRLEHNGVEAGRAKELVSLAFGFSRRQADRALLNHRAEAEAELTNYIANLRRLRKLRDK
jgi:hypothetical protein